MKIYLASRFSRIAEMAQHRATLEKLGHEVTSRWVTGVHDEVKAFQGRTEASFAEEDLTDVLKADVVISFTEPPDNVYGRGGRHVEFGVALAMNKRLIIVGWRENVFHHLPRIEFFESWDDALAILTG